MIPNEGKQFWGETRLAVVVVVVVSVVVVRVVRVVAVIIGCAGAGQHGGVWKGVFLSVCL